MSKNQADEAGTPVRKSKSYVGLLSAAILTTAVIGCALVTDTRPSVDVIDVHLTGIGLLDQQLAVALCVTNPNSNQIVFRQVTAALDVSGAPLAAGTSDLGVDLPPMASTIVPFTVITTAQNLGPQLLSIIDSGAVNYRVHGTVTFEGALGLTLPYSRSGQLDPVVDGLKLASAAMTSTRCSAARS